MTKLLVYREKFKEIYSKNSVYIIPSIRFLISFIALLILNSNVGFMTKIKNPIVALLIASICSFIPNGMIVLVLTTVFLLHIYSLSSQMAIVVLAIMLIMYIAYFRFTPKDACILLIMPLLFFFKIPYIMPLIVGIALTPISIISMSFGTIVFYILKYTKDNAVTIANDSKDSGISKVESLLQGVVNNKEMIMILIVFMIVTLLVYAVKRMSVDYSRNLAVVIGGILQLFLIICFDFILDINNSTPIWGATIGVLFSSAVAYFIQLWILTLDYSRTEYTQFEDDDYYYYVKAVPKMKVAAPEVKVKHINVQKVR